MKFKKLVSAVSALTVAAGCIAGMTITASAAEGDITTNASVDFTSDMGAFNVTSSNSSSPLEIKDGWLAVGKGAGTVTIPDEQLAGPTDKVTVSLDVAYGKLVNRNYYHNITDSDGNTLVSWNFNAYNSAINSDIVGTSEGLTQTGDFYYGYNTPITGRAASITYVFDFASKTITYSIKNNYNGAVATYTVAIPTNITNVKTLTIGSDYDNTGRRCLVDNIKITTEEGASNTVPYEIKYTLDGETVKISSGNVAPNTVVSAETSFTENGQKYYILAETLPSLTVTESNGTLEVPVRKANEYTVTVKATGDISKSINEYNVVEEEDCSYVFPMYILEGTTLYTATANSDVYYGGTVTNVESDQDIEVVYTKTSDSCVFYDELDASEGDNADVRASNGKATGNSPYTSSKELEPGEYTLIVRYQSKGRGSTLAIGDNTIFNIGTAEDRNAFKTATIDFTVTEKGNIVAVPGGSNTIDVLDTVVVLAKQPTAPEFSINLGDAYVSNGTEDFAGQVATGYIATISNAGAEGTTTQVNVTVGEVTKSAPVGITLANGASAYIGMVLNNVNGNTQSVTATVE